MRWVAAFPMSWCQCCVAYVLAFAVLYALESDAVPVRTRRKAKWAKGHGDGMEAMTQMLYVISLGGFLLVVVYALKRLIKCWKATEKVRREELSRRELSPQQRKWATGVQCGILRRRGKAHPPDSDDEVLTAALQSFLKTFQYVTKVNVKQHQLSSLAEAGMAGLAETDAILVPWLAGAEPDLLDAEMERCLRVYGTVGTSEESSKKPILVLFHNQQPQEANRVPSTQEVSNTDWTKRFLMVIDVVFDKTLGVYQCAPNDKAIQRLLTEV